MEALAIRLEKILEAIVSEYISKGEPVGSRTLSKKKDIGLSAASIRNIMSDLTDSGFITQPHVSAGRIPTDLGYRYYVDAILSPAKIDWSDQQSIKTLLSSPGMDIRDLLKQSSSVLAHLSNHAGVVTTSSAGEKTFKAIEFIRVAVDKILVILVSSGGIIQNKLIYDEDGIDQSTLEVYSRQLNDMLKDLDLHEAKERIERELAAEKTRVDAMLAKILLLGYIVISDTSSREIFIEGQSNIFDEPEFAHIEKLKALLITFEQKNNFLRILDKTLKADGIQILIGSEHGVDAIDSCSVVAYPIRTENSTFGCISVVGSKRMNYPKVVSLVETTAQVLTGYLKKVVEQPV